MHLCFITNPCFIAGKGWPLLFGGGFGVGMAYANCERALNNSLYGQNLVKSANKVIRILIFVWSYGRLLIFSK